MACLELINKYFSHHPNRDFDTDFRINGAFFCNTKNSIYKYQRLLDRSIEINYKNYIELGKKLISNKNGIIGHYTREVPTATIITEASFLCINVIRIEEVEPVKMWREADIKIKNKLFSKSLIVQIDNDNLNLKIECLSICPYSYSSKTIKESFSY